MTLVLIVFCAVFVTVVLCVGLGMAFLETSQRKKVRLMLDTVKPIETSERASLLREGVSQNAFTQWLQRFPPSIKLELLLQQSLLGWSSSRLLKMCLAGLAGGSVLGWKLDLFSSRGLSMTGLGALGFLLPVLYMLRKRSKTLNAFEKQFPDALDFLSRSMRAGHGFAMSLEALGQDAAEPLASTLRRVSHELQLGSPLNVALGKMVGLVPLVDVRFFVSTVLLQQESGGNLSEILNKLAHVIRERFQLKGQVKALSAHGRITGMVLLGMPVIVTMILLATSPDYLHSLTGDPDGRKLVYAAAAGQIVGYFVIKKIVNIRV
jgi:tight adherence protein B